MNEILKNHILHFIERITDNFVTNINGDPIVKGIFLTGSFLSCLRQSERGDTVHSPETFLPDVNYYILIDGNDAYVVEYAYILKRVITQAIEQFRQEGLHYKLSFDLHPFSLSKELADVPKDIIHFQLTTRIIDSSNIYRYAVHSWLGWRSNHRVLYPKDSNIFEQLDLPAINVRNEKWFRTLYLGLLSYGNALQVLPFYTTDKHFLLSETYKYLKELLMDGIHIAVSDAELANRDYYAIMYGWKDLAESFYEKNYDREAADIIRITIRYARSGTTGIAGTAEEPVQFMKLFFRLRTIIYEKGFKKRLADYHKEMHPGIIFEELPLWW